MDFSGWYCMSAVRMARSEALRRRKALRKLSPVVSCWPSYKYFLFGSLFGDDPSEAVVLLDATLGRQAFAEEVNMICYGLGAHTLAGSEGLQSINPPVWHRQRPLVMKGACRLR
jgi:hypothetical protein